MSSATNLATDTAVVATIDRVDSNGTPTPALEETIIGVVSGTNLVSCVRGAEGTAQAHNGGAVVEILVSAKGYNDIIDGILAEHNQLGGHTTITASTITASSVTASGIGGNVASTPLDIKTGYYQPFQTYTPGSGDTVTLDLSLGNDHRITMPAGNITLAISNGKVGQKFLISPTQDSSGSRTITWFTTIKWAGGSGPTLTTTANKRDTLGLVVTGTNTYDGFIVGQNL